MTLIMRSVIFLFAFYISLSASIPTMEIINESNSGVAGSDSSEEHNLKWKKLASKLNNNIEKDETPKCGYEVMRIFI